MFGTLNATRHLQPLFTFQPKGLDNYPEGDVGVIPEVLVGQLLLDSAISFAFKI
jgi:hypothetical protein